MTVEEQADELVDAAAAFQRAAFDAGHYPNPVGHAFVGCRVCAIAQKAKQVEVAADS